MIFGLVNGIVDVASGLFGLVCLVLVVVFALAFSPLALPFRKLKPHRRGILNERYAKKKVENEQFDAIVIGSGMGGLTCAASLSRFGKKVLVLEQHEIAGGGTHTFVLSDNTNYKFDSGLHYTVPQSAELIQLACGTRHKPIEFDKLGVEDGCFDKIVLGDVTQDGFRIKHGQKHLDTLRKMFPDEKDQKELDEFLRIATKVNGFIPVWLLSKVFPRWARKVYEKLFLKTFHYYLAQNGEELTKKLVSNPKLAAILCGLWLDEGSPPHLTSFMMTAALSVGFPKEGGAYPRGGTDTMATALIQGLETNGGKALMRAKVKQIIIDNGNEAKGVELDDGTQIMSPIVVSACGYHNTYCRLLPKSAIPSGYVKEDEVSGELKLPDELEDSSSWVMANVGIKGSPEELGIDCTNTWVQPCDEKNGWDIFKGIHAFLEDPLGNQMPMMITFPSLKDRGHKDQQHTTCQILVLVESSWFDQWEKENGKHPTGGEYEKLKKQWEDKMIDTLLTRYPAMKGKLEIVDVSTPLSIKYYLNKKGGGAVGLNPSPQRFFSEKLDMQTPIKNLWFTGEDSLLCGQPLAQLSGLMTSWRIMGLTGTVSFILGIVRLAISDLLGL